MDTLLLVKVAAIMLVLDGIWIYLVAGPAFSKVVQDVQGGPMRVRPLGAVVAYSAMILLFCRFITKESTGLDAFLLGFLTYAIFDGTNYALFDNYDMQTAIVDAIWGGALFFLTSQLVFM